MQQKIVMELKRVYLLPKHLVITIRSFWKILKHIFSPLIDLTKTLTEVMSILKLLVKDKMHQPFKLLIYYE